ncbi:hypothetical protein JYU34_007716 [Plutella xylostella]|uniref:Nuclease HARBI1 n=1 Tax=Plutella xylostella TaxID=51655 RepID=A0ABQ7QR52_PLUXY|nr:hypothetical protein JYU34_007716 [Plutella xylostella]
MYGNIETARKTIVACAVLHNIAIDMREDLFPGEEAPAAGEVPPLRPYPPTVRGNVRRGQFIETHFQYLLFLFSITNKFIIIYKIKGYNNKNHMFFYNQPYI